MHLNEVSEELYAKSKLEAERLYRSFTPIKCRAIGNQTIYFNSEGFNHLLYKKGKERAKNDQMGRFKHLDFVPKILQLTTTYQEYEEKLQDFRVERHGKKITETKQVRYWAFVAIMHNKRIKVVIRKIGEGQIIFYSICPLWKTDMYGGTFVRDLATENLEEV